MDGRAWGYALGRLTPRLRSIGILLLGLILIATGIGALIRGLDFTASGLRLVLAPLNTTPGGWAYWQSLLSLLAVGCVSYLLVEDGCRRLLLVGGRIGHVLRDAGQWVVPPLSTGKLWMIGALAFALPLIVTASWLSAALTNYPATHQGAITLSLVIIAVLTAGFIFCIHRIGRLYGGGPVLGFRLMLWYGLMKLAFINAAGYAMLLIAVACRGVEVPPISLVLLAAFLLLWWFGRNRYENAVGWWDYDEDEGFAE